MADGGPAAAPARGRFVVVEGLDGAGTTTQVSLMAGWLRQRGLAVEVTREPTTGPLGAVIRQAVEGRIDLDAAAVALAFAADRVDHWRNPITGIAAALDAGRWVVSDRYVLSSLAYQGTELDPGWVAEINREAHVPDLTVFVDTPPEVCVARMGARSARTERWDDLERLRQVREGYRRALDEGRFVGALVVVDGGGEVEAVRAAVAAAVERWLP